jgi:hypothetical protein
MIVSSSLFIGFAGKKETRRADSNRLPLLITSDPSAVAGGCSGLRWLAESSYLSVISFTGLHIVAELCALGDVEVK